MSSIVEWVLAETTWKHYWVGFIFVFVLSLLGGVYMELQYDISVLYAWAKGIWVDERIWEEYF